MQYGRHSATLHGALVPARRPRTLCHASLTSWEAEERAGGGLWTLHPPGRQDTHSHKTPHRALTPQVKHSYSGVWLAKNIACAFKSLCKLNKHISEVPTLTSRRHESAGGGKWATWEVGDSHWKPSAARPPRRPSRPPSQRRHGPRGHPHPRPPCAGTGPRPLDLRPRVCWSHSWSSCVQGTEREERRRGPVYMHCPDLDIALYFEFELFLKVLLKWVDNF